MTRPGVAMTQADERLERAYDAFCRDSETFARYCIARRMLGGVKGPEADATVERLAQALEVAACEYRNLYALARRVNDPGRN